MPATYLTPEEIHILTIERKPEKIPNHRVKELSLRIIDMAEKLLKSVGSLDFWPKKFCILFIPAIITYREIGNKIKENDIFEYKTKLSKTFQFKMLLKMLYFSDRSTMMNI